MSNVIGVFLVIGCVAMSITTFRAGDLIATGAFAIAVLAVLFEMYRQSR